jgi:hypothetical protein
MIPRTGATTVHPISHVLRHDRFETAVSLSSDLPDMQTLKLSTPVRAVHVDFSYAGAEDFLYDNLPPSEAERISTSRWAIINVWRPLFNPVARDPLAVCDARSVPEEDLVDMLAVIPKDATHKVLSKRRDIKGFNVRYNPVHKWYYGSRMRPEEALLIKIYDSKRDGRARRTPHSAFSHPETRGEDATRESIEVRCLVSWGGESAE